MNNAEINAERLLKTSATLIIDIGNATMDNRNCSHIEVCYLHISDTGWQRDWSRNKLIK